MAVSAEGRPKMKIVYVTSRLPYGPGEAFVIPEVVELVRQGHEVLVVPMYPKGAVIHHDAKPLMERVVTRSLLSPDVLKSAVLEFVRDPVKATRSLSWLLRSRNPRIFLKNLVVYPKGLWLADLARSWGAEHIHVHWMATTATMALVAGEASGISWSITAHRWDIVENNLLGLKANRAAFVRFISWSGLRMAKSLDARVRDESVCVLRMGVPALPEVHADERGRRGTAFPPIIVCPANLIPVKGHRYLLGATSILAERGLGLEVWLAGNGVLRDELEKEVEARGLSDKVWFLGQLPHPELMRLYREEEARTIVILPSIDLGNGEHEGVPVSLMEAMSHGIPVVSTTTGGIPELLEGGAGLLVPPEDPYALADGIQQLIEDPQRRRRLARAGQERVEKEFAIEKVAARLAARFEACAKGGTETAK